MTDTERQITLFGKPRRSISSDRLGTYLTAAGFDEDRALQLYIWNAHVGEAFHLPVQGAEVALRNAINSALCEKFTAQWWESLDFLRITDRERKEDLITVISRIKKRKKPCVTGQVVAGLSFGFWVGMLQSGYNIPIWSSHLRVAFPNLPADKNRFDVAASAKRVADLRNRIGHHEPILRMNLSVEYKAVMDLLTWLCPVKSEWLKPKCRVPALLREKP